ncbi:MAG: UDP-N-acetylmuramoyl-tripeptide--D-alanyl-D-alanine ligase [Planctomycetota bacterium]
MFPLTTHQLPELLPATPLAETLSAAVITGCCLDSRRIQPGDLFLAFRGQRAHGVVYAEAAAAAGAVGVVTDCWPAASGTSAVPTPTPELLQRTLLVADTASALQQLARWNRVQSSAAVIGITGSVGKTSTRQLIAAILQSRLRGCQSPANYNNELGVPLTLTRLSAGDEFAAVEMGAGRRGEIRVLCELARPSAAVVTRVAPCHLESFGSLDAIAATKAELPASLSGDGVAFLNADDPWVRGMAATISVRVVFYGEQAEGSGRVSGVTAADGCCRFFCGGDAFTLTGGRQLVSCAAAAIAVAREWGLSVDDIRRGLQTFQPDAGRGRVFRGTQWTLIDETYNCSPASLAASVTGLRDWQGSRRVLVAGEMLELGAAATALHSEVAALLAGSAVDLAIFVGEHANVCRAAALAAGFSASLVRACADVPTLLSALPELLRPGDVVLIKGSRRLQLERAVDCLRDLNGGAELFDGESHGGSGREH